MRYGITMSPNKLNGGVWCDSRPIGSTVGNCATNATTRVVRDFDGCEWISHHCTGHAAALRDSASYVSDSPIVVTS